MKEKPEMREGKKKESRALHRKPNVFSDMEGKNVIGINKDKI